MIPGQRKPDPAETVPEAADTDGPETTTAAPIFYSATVVNAGDNRAGDNFRTHHATVHAQPKQEKR